MPYAKYTVERLAELETLLARLDKKTPTIIYFTGGVDKTTAQSWCGDCVDAEPRMHRAIADCLLEKDCNYIYCSVGDRNTWKDANNEFRQHATYKLTSIPTLLVSGTKAKISDDAMTKLDTIKMTMEQPWE